MLKRLLCFAALATLTISSAYATDIGQPAPGFTVTDIAGKEQSLAAYKGKIVVLEWNNPECPFVKKHYGSGNMQALQKYALSKGVIWLTVNSSAPAKQGYMGIEEAKARIIASKAQQTAYILDPKGDIGELYTAKTTPHMFVIDKAGNLAYQGAIDDKPTPNVDDIKEAQNYVRSAINALRAGKAPEVTETRAYGCGVKYAN